MGLEISNFDKKMSVALFTKNFRPIGTRFLTLQDLNSFYPSIEIASSGEEIEIIVYWQTVVSMPPHFNIVIILINFLINLRNKFAIFVVDWLEKSRRLVPARKYKNRFKR
jgi:hypothetical protein